MIETYNIYCDESCHLEHDDSPVMVIGGIWCKKNISKKICCDIRDIKEKHHLRRGCELKWNTVSKSKIGFYKDIISYFFHNDLNFRAVVASKRNLRHEDYSQTHDQWYYKIYYQTLINIINSYNIYNIFVDIKERRRGGVKVRKLKKVLSNKLYDFNEDIINNIQIVDSKDVEILQVADLLIGALGYLNKGLKTNSVKLELIEHIKLLSKKTLEKNTLPSEQKFNIFYWSGE